MRKGEGLPTRYRAFWYNFNFVLQCKVYLKLKKQREIKKFLTLVKNKN